MPTSNETAFTLTEMRVIHDGFKGQCGEMNEARLTSALGDAIDLLQEAREVLEDLIGFYETESGDPESETLVRARALYQRLHVK